MSEADAVPEHATTVDGDAHVAQAAADLGVEVPNGFFLAGTNGSGQHIAFMHGNASALRISAATLRRLDGHSVADSLASPEEEPGPRPEWMPPGDLNDTEAWDAWMAERARHPEWPVFYNSPTDWIPLLVTGTGLTALITSAASVMKQRDRIKFAKWLVEKAEARGLTVDAVAMMRAFEGGRRNRPRERAGSPAPQGRRRHGPNRYRRARCPRTDTRPN